MQQQQILLLQEALEKEKVKRLETEKRLETLFKEAKKQSQCIQKQDGLLSQYKVENQKLVETNKECLLEIKDLKGQVRVLKQ
jgi:hypothetical protein